MLRQRSESLENISKMGDYNVRCESQMSNISCFTTKRSTSNSMLNANFYLNKNLQSKSKTTTEIVNPPRFSRVTTHLLTINDDDGIESPFPRPKNPTPPKDLAFTDLKQINSILPSKSECAAELADIFKS